MLDSIHGLGEPNTLIRKALIMITNGLLTYEISFSIIKNSGSAEILSAIIFALSILIGDILIPFTVIGGILTEYQNYLTSIISTGKFYFNSSLEVFLLSLVFLFVIPLISLVRFRSSRSFITSGSILLSQFNPIWSLLLFSGISQSDNYIVNVLSAIPIAIIFPLYFYGNFLGIVIVAMIIIAAVTYAIKSYYGLVGVVFVALAYILLTKLGYTISILSVVVSLAIYSSNLMVSIVRSQFENKKAYETLKSSLTEDLKNINSILYSLKAELAQENSDINNTISGYITQITKLQDEVLQCKNVECEEEVKSELSNVRRMITMELNNLIFDKIKSYNDFSGRLKFLGINIPELEYPKEEIKIEEFLDFYHNLKNVVDKNILTATNMVNNLIDNLSRTLGIYMQKVKVINKDSIIEKVESIDIKDINTKLNLCLSKATEISEILLTTPDTFELKKDIATLPLQQFTINKLVQSSKVLERFTNVILSELSMSYSAFKDISTRFSTPELKSLEEIMNALVITFQSASTPYCEKVNRLYGSLTNIEQIMEYVRERDVILQLEEIIDVILPQIKQKDVIELEELGINQKYVDFLLKVLNNRGIAAKLEGNKIILRNGIHGE
jgi:ribosomal protein S17E